MSEPMAEAFNVELREVDLRSLFAASDEGSALARRMETELHLSKPKLSSSDSIVEGALLPKLKRTPFYVFFHLDRTKDDFFPSLAGLSQTRRARAQVADGATSERRNG